jgi:hypothetical protein
VEDIPTTAYVAQEEVQTDGKEIQSVFKHVACFIQAEEAEEVLLSIILHAHTIFLNVK